MPLYQIPDISRSIQEKKETGTPLIALEIHPNAVSLENFTWPDSGILLVGNEELGLSPEILSQADSILKIPQFGRKASLNVANAFAIAACSLRNSLG